MFYSCDEYRQFRYDDLCRSFIRLFLYVWGLDLGKLSKVSVTDDKIIGSINGLFGFIFISSCWGVPINFFFNFLQLSSLSKMLVTLFIPGIIAVLTKGSDLVRIYLNSLSLFTIFMIMPFKQLLDRLYRCVSFTELNQVFYDIQIFKSKSARIFIWHIQSSAPVSITSETPLLPNDVIMILQYRERVFRYQLEPLIQSFKGTPLQTNIDALVTFMDEHDILAVSLLQQSGEMVGVMAIRTPAQYRDILENDIYMLRQLEDGLTACIINLESMERLASHQMILEDVNAALSFMDLSTEKTEFQEQVSMSLLKVVPTMKSLFSYHMIHYLVFIKTLHYSRLNQQNL